MGCTLEAKVDIQMTANRHFIRLNVPLCVLVIAMAFVTGCTTAGREKQPENTLRPFDAQQVATLSHEAYKIAWDAHFWARRDLRFAAFRPTTLDWDAVGFLDQITRQVPWVAKDIEKHPASPRASSRRSSDFVRYDTMMLKKRYQPASFQRTTDVKIEKLLRILDEIGSYYDEEGGIKQSQ